MLGPELSDTDELDHRANDMANDWFLEEHIVPGGAGSLAVRKLTVNQLRKRLSREPSRWNERQQRKTATAAVTSQPPSTCETVTMWISPERLREIDPSRIPALAQPGHGEVRTRGEIETILMRLERQTADDEAAAAWQRQRPLWWVVTPYDVLRAMCDGPTRAWGSCYTMMVAFALFVANLFCQGSTPALGVKGNEGGDLTIEQVQLAFGTFGDWLSEGELRTGEYTTYCPLPLSSPLSSVEGALRVCRLGAHC